MFLNEISLFVNKTALHIAIQKGFTDIVKILLSNSNIDVNSKSV